MVISTSSHSAISFNKPYFILKNDDEVSKIKKYFASYVISITFAVEQIDD